MSETDTVKPTPASLPAVATAITSARNAAGWTTPELAAAAGLTKSTVYRIEAGKENPTLLTLEKIAAVLGMTLRVSFE